MHGAVIDAHSGDAHALANPCPAAPRAFRQRQRQPAGIEIAVGGQEGGTQHALLRHEWEAPVRLFGAHQLEGQAEARRPTGLALQLLHPLA